MCYECDKRRAAALKASPTRQAYNPIKASGQRRMMTSAAMPKVKMSFGRRKK